MVTSYMVRFINNLKKKITKTEEMIKDNMLTVTEYDYALDSWIESEQSKIRHQANFNKLESLLKLVEEDDILRLQILIGIIMKNSLCY